ncbi:hypothetical protein KA005_85960, partial [bacterium]|nr:hypothetical protein [bacterium]
MAKRGLERRVALILVPLLLSWFLVSSFIVIYKGKRAIAHQVKGEVKRLTAAFTASRYESLADLVNTIGDKFDKSTWVSVYDKKLNCVASTIGKRIGGGEDLRIAVQMGCQIEGFEKEGNKRIYHVITPLFSESGRATMDGLLEVGISLNGINGYIFSAYRDILLILLLCIGVVGAIFYLTFRRYVTAPVQRLIDWIDLPDKDIELGGKGEISALAHSLSTTVKTTNLRIKKLECSNTDLKQEIEKKTTRLRKMSQDLEEAQDHLVRAGTLSALGEFAAGISHELNNPLGIILGFSQVLVDEVDSRHPHYENLRRIEIESSRCKKIVDDLLNFARPSDPYLEMVELNEIIDETLALISYHT